MPKQKKHLTRKKTKARGKADIVPFLLKQKLGNLSNTQKQATLKNILSNLPKQGVEDAITQQELAIKELAEKPRLYQIPPLANYNYPFQRTIPRGYEYNYPLIKLMNTQQETDLVDRIYSLRRNAELPSNFLKTLFANFLKLTKKRRQDGHDYDYILSRIPDYELQQVLTTNKFFIIDFDFLSNALEITGPKLTTRGSYSGTSKYSKGNASVNARATKKFKSYNEYIIKKIKNTIGAKRNVGIQRSQHDIILFMDDDDHYPPSSFRRRVSTLLTHSWKPKAAACTTIACYDLLKGMSAVNTPPWDLPLRKRISEATLVFYKSWWEAKGFPEVSVAEGEGFLEGREGDVLELPPQQIIVAMSHKTNSTSRKFPDGRPSCFWGFPKEFLKWLHGLVDVEIE